MSMGHEIDGFAFLITCLLRLFSAFPLIVADDRFGHLPDPVLEPHWGPLRFFFPDAGSLVFSTMDSTIQPLRHIPDFFMKGAVVAISAVTAPCAY